MKSSRRASLPELAERVTREQEFWRTSDHERPGVFAPRIIVQKMAEAAGFLEAFDRYRARFESAGTILELGAGQGWASCLAKALLGGEHRFIVTDVSEDAIGSASVWEEIFRTRLDETRACPSFELYLPDASVDLVFCFQSAHHFGAHRRTLAEIRRVLAPGGACLYLHEPTAPEYLYSAAVTRVNRKRESFGHDVVEDVIIGERMLSIGTGLGLRSTRVFNPSLAARGEKQFAYFLVLKRLGGLQRLLPATADFIFEKP